MVEFPYSGCFDAEASRAFAYAHQLNQRLLRQKFDIEDLLFGIVSHFRETHKGFLFDAGCSWHDVVEWENWLRDECPAGDLKSIEYDECEIGAFSESVLKAVRYAILATKVRLKDRVDINSLLAGSLTVDSRVGSDFVLRTGLKVPALESELDSIGTIENDFYGAAEIKDFIVGVTPGRTERQKFVPRKACFDTSMQDSIRESVTIAKRNGLNEPNLSHLLSAVLQNSSNTDRVLAPWVAQQHGVSEEIDRSSKAPQVGGSVWIGNAYFSVNAYLALKWASELAQSFAAKWVDADWIVLGILETDSSFSQRILSCLDISCEEIRNRFSSERFDRSGYELVKKPGNWPDSFTVFDEPFDNLVFGDARFPPPIDRGIWQRALTLVGLSRSPNIHDYFKKRDETSQNT